jgi:hypothetical protein
MLTMLYITYFHNYDADRGFADWLFAGKVRVGVCPDTWSGITCKRYTARRQECLSTR